MDADLEIAYVGGPEVTPATEQLTGVSNGVFDMMFGAAGYMSVRFRRRGRCMEPPSRQWRPEHRWHRAA